MALANLCIQAPPVKSARHLEAAFSRETGIFPSQLHFALSNVGKALPGAQAALRIGGGQGGIEGHRGGWVQGFVFAASLSVGEELAQCVS